MFIYKRKGYKWTRKKILRKGGIGSVVSSQQLGTEEKPAPNLLLVELVGLVGRSWGERERNNLTPRRPLDMEFVKPFTLA